MSTPPVTETFVTGDRVSYTYERNTFHGTIEKPHSVSGWYVLTLEEYSNGIFVLPGENMALLERKLTDLQKLVSRLEEEIADWVDAIGEADFEAHPADIEYAFDQGYLSGLRQAINAAKALAE